MKTCRKYYVVDVIAENVIGNFEAVSEAMALKVFNDSIVKNEKLNYSSDQYRLYRDPDSFDVCETFTEIEDVCDKVVVE